MVQLAGNDGTIFRIEKEDENVYVVEMVESNAEWVANTRITREQLIQFFRSAYDEFFPGVVSAPPSPYPRRYGRY